MRREFPDETAIAADVETAGGAIGRILSAWLGAITEAERVKVGALLDDGSRFGLIVLLNGEAAPPSAEIVCVRADGEVLSLGELTYMKKNFQ